MSDQLEKIQTAVQQVDLSSATAEPSDEIAALRSDFQARLVTANLRTEAIRAGMVDLDGLKLIERSSLRLDNDDSVVGGRQLMETFKAKKPWLFAPASSSSGAAAPTAQPVRQKTALEMTDEEYTAARAVVTKYRI